MIEKIMFYLNKNKPSVYDAAGRCVALCRERGIVPCFFEEDREDVFRQIADLPQAQ